MKKSSITEYSEADCGSALNLIVELSFMFKLTLLRESDELSILT